MKVIDDVSTNKDDVTRIPKTLVLSDWGSLMNCLSECPHPIVMYDSPKTLMIGYICEETGDTWSIRIRDARATAPKEVGTREFRLAVATTHNEALKKK